jgi:hypothetical protein
VLKWPRSIESLAHSGMHSSDAPEDDFEWRPSLARGPPATVGVAAEAVAEDMDMRLGFAIAMLRFAELQRLRWLRRRISLFVRPDELWRGMCPSSVVESRGDALVLRGRLVALSICHVQRSALGLGVAESETRHRADSHGPGRVHAATNSGCREQRNYLHTKKYRIAIVRVGAALHHASCFDIA